MVHHYHAIIVLLHVGRQQRDGIKFLACWGKLRGLAHSPWDGYGWPECELSWSNCFRIKRLEKLGITGSLRPFYW